VVVAERAVRAERKVMAEFPIHASHGGRIHDERPKQVMITVEERTMCLLVRSLSGRIVTLDVQPTTLVQEVINLVQDWERPYLSGAEVKMFNRLIREAPLGGLRLADNFGNIMPTENLASCIHPDMCHGLKFMYQMVIRKRNDDHITPDDLKMMETMRTTIQQRVDAAGQGYDDETILRVALSPPPGLQYTFSVKTGVGKKHRRQTSVTFDCQLVLGSPFWMSSGLNTRGITYSPPAIDQTLPPPDVFAHLARHANGNSEWFAFNRSLESVTGFLGSMGVSPLCQYSVAAAEMSTEAEESELDDEEEKEEDCEWWHKGDKFYKLTKLAPAVEVPKKMVPKKIVKAFESGGYGPQIHLADLA
jgi:hypothetical protein